MVILAALGSFAHAQQQAGGQKQVSSEQLLDDAVQLMRKDIRSQKKQLVAANMPLTDEEATKFWQVYDKYTAETIKLNDTRYALIKEYGDSYASMTDTQAASFIKRWIAADQAVSELRLKWIPEFQNVISSKKTALFFQIDRRAGLIVDLQLASQIPLVNP